MAAGILALFLGTFGIHNFYLGYTGKALFQLLGTLLSCGFLVPLIAIWAFIEGILILVARPGEAPWGVDASGMPLSG
ncbi:MAG: TM2 domain-containing protein [Actinomyces oris]